MNRTGYRMHPVRTPLTKVAAVCAGLVAIPLLVVAYRTATGGIHPAWFWPSASTAALAAVYPAVERPSLLARVWAAGVVAAAFVLAVGSGATLMV